MGKERHTKNTFLPMGSTGNATFPQECMKWVNKTWFYEHIPHNPLNWSKQGLFSILWGNMDIFTPYKNIFLYLRDFNVLVYFDNIHITKIYTSSQIW